MVVVDTYAVHHHAAVVVHLETTSIAYGAVVHTRTLVDIAGLAKPELTVVLHFVIDHLAWSKTIVEQEVVHRVLENWYAFADRGTWCVI